MEKTFKYFIVDIRNGSGNIVLAEYKNRRTAERRAKAIAKECGEEIAVCKKLKSVKL
jgi:hypothetical protein